jgi:phage portal protein BeeE
MERLGRVPVELWVVRPDRVEVVTSPRKFLTGYIYHGPSGEEVPIDREDMLSLRLPNPMDPYRGLSPVQTITDNLLSAQAASRWNRSFFQNGARPGGVVTFPGTRIMGDTEWKKFKSRWDEQHRGVSKANSVAFMEGGAEWHDVTFSQKDMMFTDLARLDKESIREAYGAPKFLTGDVEDVNRATAEASKTWIAEGMTVPRLDRWKGMLNNDYLPQFPGFDRNLSLIYTSPVPADREADREDKKAAAQVYKELRGAGVTPEDAAKVAGLPPMDTVSPSPTGDTEFQAQLKGALV